MISKMNLHAFIITNNNRREAVVGRGGGIGSEASKLVKPLVLLRPALQWSLSSRHLL